MTRRAASGPAARERKIRYSDDLVWGVHPVLELLESEPRRVVEIYLDSGRHGGVRERIIDAARRGRLKLTFVDRLKISGAADLSINHQGVVARCAPVALQPFAELLSRFSCRCREKQLPRLIACDTIQDPHNLGAIIRTARAAGVEGLIATRDRSAPLGGTVAKASAGALARLPVCQPTNLAAAMQQLKDAGGWVFGAVSDKEAQSIYETDFRVPACLVIGNEGRGIRPLVRKRCDTLVTIPMAGGVESLNSSAAAAVILFEMRRQLLEVA